MTTFLSDILAIVEAVSWDVFPNKSRLNLASFGGMYDFRPILIDIDTQDSVPTGLFFSVDGTKMYEVGVNTGGTIYESDLAVPWDIETATFNQSIAAQDAIPSGIFFRPDGTKMYEIGNDGNLIYESDLSTSWDISTATLNQSISTQNSIPTDIFFSPDGTKMFELGLSGNLIYESDLSTPWDISTAILNQSVSSQGSGPQGFFFKSDGTKVYEVSASASLLFESDLSIPWDISTITLLRSVPQADTSLFGVFFKPDGTKVYQLSSGGGDKIYSLDLSVPWNVFSSPYLKKIATQDSNPTGIFFSPDGLKMYEVGSSDDLIYESNLTEPFDINTAVFFQSIATQDAQPSGIFFSPNGTKMYEIGNDGNLIYESDLSISWDISSAAFSQSIATQDSNPTGIFFSPDGTKMYECDNGTQLIYESDLSTPWDISTAILNQSIAASGSNVQDIFISEDGVLLFQIDATTDLIYKSSISTPWDISTVSLLSSVSSLANKPTALTFAPSGLRMFVCEGNGDLIYEINLPHAWDIQYAKVYYAGRIASNTIFESQINVVFWGGQTINPDFGFMDIDITDQNADIIDFAKKVTLANISFYRVRNDGTIRQLSLAQTSEIGFSDENTVRMRLVSRLSRVFEQPINEFFYDADNPDLDGRPYPILWGPGATSDINEARQMTPCLLVETGSTPTYHFTDLDVIDLGDVDQAPMDEGIALGPSQFTIVDNGFALDASAIGKVTFFQPTDGGVKDPNDDERLVGMFRFIRLAAQRVNIYDNLFIPTLLELNELLPADDFPQYQSLNVIKLKDFMAALFDSFAGYFYVDFSGIVRYGQLTPPEDETPVFEFTDSNTTGTIQVNDDTAPNLSDRIQYGQNWGALDEADLAGDLDDNELRRARTTEQYEKKTGEDIIEFYQPARSTKSLKWNGRYAQSEVISTDSLDDAPQDVFLRYDGLKMYEVGYDSNGGTIYESDLIVPWDIETATFVRSISSQDDIPTGIFFSPDGLKLYEIGAADDLIYESDLSIPWDISTATFNQSIATQESDSQDVFFSPDGLQLYEVSYDSSAGTLNQSVLSTAWDLSTAVVLQNINTQGDNPTGIFFKPDGTKMYEVDLVNDLIYELNLSTAWDISTATLNQSIATQASNSTGIFFSPDGAKIFEIAETGSIITTPATWDPSYDNTTYPEATLSESDLLATGVGAANDYPAVSSIVIPKTGKWRVELEVVGTVNSSNFAGVSNEDNYDNQRYPGIGSDEVGYFYNGNKYIAGSMSAYGSAFSDGDFLDMLIDSDNQKAYFALNGTYQNSGDPGAGTGYATNALAATKALYVFVTAHPAGCAWRINCGQSAWAYSLDSNYIGLSS